MAKNTHLTLDERIEIEGSLNERTKIIQDDCS